MIVKSVADVRKRSNESFEVIFRRYSKLWSRYLYFNLAQEFKADIEYFTISFLYYFKTVETKTIAEKLC